MIFPGLRMAQRRSLRMLRRRVKLCFQNVRTKTFLTAGVESTKHTCVAVKSFVGCAKFSFQRVTTSNATTGETFQESVNNAAHVAVAQSFLVSRVFEDELNS